MAKTIRRRRFEGKTDYKARFGLIKSGMQRVVVRKTNRYILGQIVESKGAQDFVIANTSSKDLIGKGWPANKSGSLKNRVAAYLTGYHLGKLALSKKVSEAILDIGMHRNIQKSRIFSFLKGAVDAGLKVPHGKDALPSDDFISINAEFKKIMEKIKA